MRANRTSVAALVLAAALAGCGTDAATGESPGGPTSAAMESATGATAAAGAAESGAGSTVAALSDPAPGDPARSRETASTAPPAGPAAPKIDSDPERLLGLASAGVARLLGKPGLVRRDGPAEVWQYRAASCILDVFLYDSNGALKVTYFELRGRGATHQSRRECFAGMLQGGDAGKTG